jgi:hypothetical protein
MNHLQQGTVVKNQYGKTLTVLESIGNLIRTVEEPTLRYSPDKLYIKGISVRDYLKIK